MLIWLDLPVVLRFWRILRRTVVQQGRQRPDLPEGCREGFHRETLPFWHFVWRTPCICAGAALAAVASCP